MIGSPGVGKTYFAKRLAAHINSHHYNLDDCYWQKDWIRPKYNEWQTTLEQLLKKGAWVIDGNYHQSLSLRLRHADIVILLRKNKLVCLYGFIKRSVKRFLYLEALPKQVGSCRRFKLNWRFMRFIYSFDKEVLPKMFEQISAQNTKLIELRGEKAIHQFLKECKS